MKKFIRESVICTAGTVLIAIAVNIIISPLGLYNGGSIGISQLVQYVFVALTHVNITWLNIVGIVYFMLNVPLFILAYSSLSKAFFNKTVYCVILLTVMLSVIPVPKHTFTSDMLTACIIGGIVNGIGVGIVLQAGSSCGGTDILGVYCTKKRPYFSVGKITFLVNAFVYVCCALLFDIEIAVYSLIYAGVSSLVTDKLHFQNINTTVMIFTKKPDIDDYLIQETKRGVTMWKGKGGYTKEELNIALIAMSKYEVPSLRRKLSAFDKNAFIIINEGNPIYGNFEKRLET